ncbi:unnamed protein product [Prorocentrum cordatum]|uniref:Calpain catalytic domain-containing protein n=1 Tax=Prorocentrum cordatum TaxID=2364126 RepID=A0ABN9S4E8_9DINO|nr:unnamed protein product [Polarella glacialis]
MDGPPSPPREPRPGRGVGVAQVARRLCSYVECPMVAVMVNQANGSRELLTPAQRRRAQALSQREPHNKLAAEIGCSTEADGGCVQVVLRSLHGGERLALRVHPDTSAGAVRARLADCLGVWEDSGRLEPKAHSGSTSWVRVGPSAPGWEVTLHAGVWPSMGPERCGGGVWFVESCPEEQVAILSQGCELRYAEPVPVPRASRRTARARTRVEFTAVVDLSSLAMDELALAQGLSHISTRGLALHAVSTLKDRLASCYIRDCIADFIASPLVETVAVEKTYRDTAAADYARQRAIRDLARQDLFRTASRRKLAEATKANVHRDSRVHPGPERSVVGQGAQWPEAQPMATDVGLALQDEELWALLGLEDAQLCTFFEDLDAAHKMVDHLRSTASLPVVIHRLDLKRFPCATAGDCGGVGSDDCQYPQQDCELTSSASADCLSVVDAKGLRRGAPCCGYAPRATARCLVQCMREDWVALVEKAYAKVHGSYENISSDTHAEALEDIFGTGTAHVDVGDFPIWGELWQHLRGRQRRGFAQVAVRHGMERPGELLNSGLLSGYSYPITRFEFVKGEMVCELQNPWPAGEWTGRWGRGSCELIHCQDGHELRPSPGACRPFRMGIQDFCKHFTDVFEARTVPGSWQSAAVTCSAERPSYPLVSVTSPAQALFVLSQPDRRLLAGEPGADGAEYPSGIGLRVYRCRVVAPPPNSVGARQNVSSPFGNLELLAEKPITKARSVLVEVARLEPHSLYIAVAVSEFGLQCAKLRVLTQCNMRFRELSAPESRYLLQAEETAVAVADSDSFSSQGSLEPRPVVATPSPARHGIPVRKLSDARDVEGWHGWLKDEISSETAPAFLKACLTTCGGC